MNTDVTISIELDNGEAIKLNYDEGKSLFEKLYEVYGKGSEPAFIPFVRPIEPYPIVQPWCETSSVCTHDNKGDK